MVKNLVIVESPAKAKTIEKYLGKDYIVKSSYGHIRDLAKKGMSINIENNFEPDYEVQPDKKQVVSELKKLAKDAETIWLATDEDREGEAISWHLKEALKLKDQNTKRITFNEITKTAVQNAIENPRKIDANLVDAQQARRILDRLVGFELSPVLWRKVKPSLSAGRVQSVAVRLVVEKEREIRAFEPNNYFKVQAVFEHEGKTFNADLATQFKTKKEAEEFLENCKGADIKVKGVKKRPGKKSPAAPFTTSTLQQQASVKLGFSVSRTMSVAQRLYESGNITYMRTDSVNLSDQAIGGAKNEIISAYGADYANPKKYKSKSAGAQEAHEAIRPTDFSKHEISAGADEERLYELIWKRTIASQMSDAELERTTVNIEVEGVPYEFVAKGEIIKFDGFLKVYLEANIEGDEDEEVDGLLPDLKSGDALQRQIIKATERFTRPPARYNEASLVKKLEELGIGRPSTYAPTISTIQKRNYVEKEEKEGKERKYHVLTLEDDNLKDEEATEITGREKNRLSPTDIGEVVTDFLVEHFGGILDYHFTAEVEKEFDNIAKGLNEWTKMIHSFYEPFHQNVEKTMEESERATGERELGEDPKTGKPVIARIGRFGPMVQIGAQEDDDKKFASLRKNQSITTITLEEALELFKLPRTLGEFEGKEVSANIGRFGPYVRHDNKFASIPKDGDDDPMTIDLERAIELIKAKREADKKKFINEFDHDPTIQVLNGRYGPYIKMGRKNFKIPKDQKPEALTKEDCLKIVEEQKKAPKKKTKKKAAKKTTKKK